MAKYDDETLLLARQCYRNVPFMDFMQVHFALYDLVKTEGAYVMDNTKYAFQTVGLPENIPYFFRPKHPLGWALFQELLLSAASSSDDESTLYAKEIVGFTDWNYQGYEKPIPLKDAYIWLEKAYRKHCYLKVVPDADYLEGGSRHGQCDGWSYHFELDLEKPYYP